MITAILNILLLLFNALRNLYSDLTKRVSIIDVSLHGPQEGERQGKRCWIFELTFTIRAPKGSKVRGMWVITPRINREGRWINYAPLRSPPMEIVSIVSFAPLHVETDFKSYIYVYGGSGGIGFTSAIADISEPFELLLEVVVEGKEYRGTVKRLKLQKLVKKYRKKVENM